MMKFGVMIYFGSMSMNFLVIQEFEVGCLFSVRVPSILEPNDQILD